MKRFTVVFSPGYHELKDQFSRDCGEFVVRSPDHDPNAWRCAQILPHFHMADQDFTMYTLKYSHCIQQIIFVNEWGEDLELSGELS